MESKDISEQITALIDNELTDQEEVKRLQELIDHNYDARLEFLIHSNLKAAVGNHLPFVETPDYLRERILRNIRVGMLYPSLKKEDKVKSSRIERFFKPKYAFAAAFSIIVIAAAAFLFYFSNSNSLKDNNRIQNMLVQARLNFQKISEGKLPLQDVSSSPEAIKHFFREKGVKFEPIVPEFDDFKLIGGIVSDNKGEKLPHNLYKGNNGKLVYLYQADENCIKNKIVSLSSNISKVVNGGRYYKISDGNQSALVWKHRGKVCIIVSNDNIDQIEDRFLALRNNW